MASLTITVDEEILKRARIRAIERGDSINAFLADQLRRYSEDEGEIRQQRAVARLIALSETLSGSSKGPHGAGKTCTTIGESHEGVRRHATRTPHPRATASITVTCSRALARTAGSA